MDTTCRWQKSPSNVTLNIEMFQCLVESDFLGDLTVPWKSWVTRFYKAGEENKQIKEVYSQSKSYDIKVLCLSHVNRNKGN